MPLGTISKRAGRRKSRRTAASLPRLSLRSRKHTHAPVTEVVHARCVARSICCGGRRMRSRLVLVAARHRGAAQKCVCYPARYTFARAHSSHSKHGTSLAGCSLERSHNSSLIVTKNPAARELTSPPPPPPHYSPPRVHLHVVCRGFSCFFLLLRVVVRTNAEYSFFPNHRHARKSKSGTIDRRRGRILKT